MTMVTIAWSCYFPWRPCHDHSIFHDDHAMILPWSNHGEYDSPWSYHVIAWSSCLTMDVNPGESSKIIQKVFGDTWNLTKLSCFSIRECTKSRAFVLSTLCSSIFSQCTTQKNASFFFVVTVLILQYFVQTCLLWFFASDGTTDWCSEENISRTEYYYVKFYPCSGCWSFS